LLELLDLLGDQVVLGADAEEAHCSGEVLAVVRRWDRTPRKARAGEADCMVPAAPEVV